jgi:hypothetical protein
MCGFCKPVQPPATHDGSLVMSRGERFESARRLSRFGVGKRYTCDEPSPLYRLHLTLVEHRLCVRAWYRLPSCPLDCPRRYGWMAALQPYCRVLGNVSLESHLSAGRGALTDMLLGDDQGAIVARFGWGIEQYSGLALTHAGEGASIYALSSRDEPQFEVAARFGLLEVVELQLDLLIAGGLRPDYGHTPVPFEPCGHLGGRYQSDGR